MRFDAVNVEPLPRTHSTAYEMMTLDLIGVLLIPREGERERGREGERERVAN